MRMFAAKHTDRGSAFTQVHATALQVELCGYKATAVDVIELPEATEGCFYGWKSKDGQISMIQPSLIQLKMRSPDFFEGGIARGEGCFVPLSVIEAVATTAENNAPSAGHEV